MVNKNKIKFVILFISFLVILASCTQQQKVTKSQSEAENTVRTYFEAWNKQDWPTMYGVISDGFKKIDSTAKTLQDFEVFANKQDITSVKINSITEKINDGITAVVDYDVIFTINGELKPFMGTFTLKYRKNDKNPGWKLIHPYGENIDNS